MFCNYDNYLDKTVKNLIGDLAKEKYLAVWQVHGSNDCTTVSLRFVPVSQERLQMGGHTGQFIKHNSTNMRNATRYNDWRQRNVSNTPVMHSKSVSCSPDDFMIKVNEDYSMTNVTQHCESAPPPITSIDVTLQGQLTSTNLDSQPCEGG